MFNRPGTDLDVHMQHIPVLTAYRLDLAEKILEDRNIRFCLKESVPVRSAEKISDETGLNPLAYRIIRQRVVKDGILELVVAREAATL